MFPSLCSQLLSMHGLFLRQGANFDLKKPIIIFHFVPVSGFSNRTLAKCGSIWTKSSNIFSNIHRQIRYMWILWNVSWKLSGSTSVTIGRTRLVSLLSRATIWKTKFLKYFERNKVKLQKKMRDVLHANARLSHWKAVFHVEIV